MSVLSEHGAVLGPSQVPPFSFSSDRKPALPAYQHSLRNWLFQMPSICYDLKRRHRFLCPQKEQEKEFYTREIFILNQRQRPRKPGGADCITSGLPPKHPLSRKREEQTTSSMSQRARRPGSLLLGFCIHLLCPLECAS